MEEINKVFSTKNKNAEVSNSSGRVENNQTHSSSLSKKIGQLKLKYNTFIDSDDKNETKNEIKSNTVNLLRKLQTSISHVSHK